MIRDSKYDLICKKMGCTIENFPEPNIETEDDNYVNPFSRLTREEKQYLLDAGYIKFSNH